MEDKTKSIDKYICWYVTIIWRPNTWKSTFINTLIGEKVSIVSPTPQTTRKKVLWMYNDDESQVIFLDTPGIHKGQYKLNDKLNEEALWSIESADVILYFVDPTRPQWEEEAFLKWVFESVKKPKLKVFTKADIQKVEEPESFSISSKTKHGFDELLMKIKSLLPNWPLLYPQDFYTYQTIPERAEEIVREKIFLHLKEEIPHSSYVTVDEVEDTGKMLKILSYIYVESESQKKIIIGKWGAILTMLWKEARLELERIFWKKVFLSLRVKVAPKWRQDEWIISRLLSK